MIKSYLLNNLFVPLRQISPPMLLASAALHSLLFLVPIPSNSTDTKLSEGSNPPGENTPKVPTDVCDEYLSQRAAKDSFSEEILDGVGEDSLSEEIAEVAGEDSLSEEIAEEAGEDSLNEEIVEEAGEDSLNEEIVEEAGEDSLNEEIVEEAAADSLSEEIVEESTTPDLKELCDSESLPQGKAIKVPKETPLLSDLEGASNGEEIGDGEDAIPDLASGDSDESDSAIDEIPTPTDDFSAGEDDISSEELPTSTGNLSLIESESEPEIAFTPSESDDESIDDTVSEPVDESIDDTVSEPVDESIDDTVSEPVDESIDDTVSEPVDESIDDTVSEPVDESTDDTVSEAVDEPEETTDTESNSGETPSETDNQPKPRPVDPFANFPNYANVKPYVCGVQIARIDRRTRRTSDPLDSVQAYFEKKLANTDFQVEKLTDNADTKVYQVSKGNLTQFLQLFAVEKQGTMILLSSRRVDCYRLSNQSLPEKADSKTEEQNTEEQNTEEQITEEQITEEQITEEQITEEQITEEQIFDAAFQNLYAQLGWMEEKEFAKTSEIEKIFGKDINNSPEELALLVVGRLESEGFEASQVNKENSELLYEVKKGEFTKYISFVPTKEGKGAVILAMKNSP